MFRGSITALITPFRNGKLDETAFRSFVEWQIEEGTEGLVPCGTTGESPTLSHAEHKRVTEICIDAADGKVPLPLKEGCYQIVTFPGDGLKGTFKSDTDAGSCVLRKN